MEPFVVHHDENPGQAHFQSINLDATWVLTHQRVRFDTPDVKAIHCCHGVGKRRADKSGIQCQQKLMCFDISGKPAPGRRL